MTDGPVPAFKRFSSTLYLRDNGTDDVGLLAYVISPDLRNVPTSISFRDSFGKFEGHYFWIPVETSFKLASESAGETFAAAARAFVKAHYDQGNNRGFVWVESLREDGQAVFGDPESQGFAFAIRGRSGNAKTASQMSVKILRQLTLQMMPGINIELYQSGWLISTPGQGQNLSFISSPTGFGPTIEPKRMFLPFTGPRAGTFCMTGSFESQVTFAQFRLGIQYVYRQADPVADIAQTFPVFNLPPGQTRTLQYRGAIDPIDPMNIKPTSRPGEGWVRSLFAVVTEGDQPLTFPSYWRTTENKPITLVTETPPLAANEQVGPPRHAAGFANQVLDNPGQVQSAFYWTLAGDWGMAVDGASPHEAFLPGLFGSESMTFVPFKQNSTYDVLRFVPSRPAYAPIFPFQTASLTNTDSGSVGDRLDSKFHTAWAVVAPGKGNVVAYRAEPEGGPLYGNAQTIEQTVLLDRSPSSTLLPDTPNLAVPVVPYSGLPSPRLNAWKQQDFGLFESQILSPARKRVIGQTFTPALKAAREARSAQQAIGKPAATPQGLMANVSAGASGSQYDKVTLGISATDGQRAPEFAFWHLEPPLQNLFQSNQLFSVAVNPQFLGTLTDKTITTPPAKSTFGNTITIAKWTMTANVGKNSQATDYRNVMIFKFCDGSLRERVANPNRWVDTGEFSVLAGGGDESLVLTGLSQWLQDYMDEAIEAGKTNKLYENFARIAQDPNWNGVVVLRATVDPAGFPDEIKGLTAGIDFSQFEAHHVGVTVSRIKVVNGEPTINGISSSFGLIDYQLPMFKQNVRAGGNPDDPLGLQINGDFGFTVLQLQALFENAAMTSFTSRVQLTVNHMFNTRVIQAADASGPLEETGVVLLGTYQSQGGTDAYVFQQQRKTIFEMDSNAYNAIAFNRVQFNTLTANSGGVEPQIRSRFVIWGAFDFRDLPDRDKQLFDIQSFGTTGDLEISDRGNGLAFSNLTIDLASPVNNPNAVSFTFTASNIGFDLASSTIRKSSLFPSFALEIDRFIDEGGEKRPVDYGFLPIATNLNLEAIDGPWYGLVYKVTMGGAGALAANAGFESRMLLAWSPQAKHNDSRFSVFAGIQLPGTAPGAKLLSLQGILKVSIENIALIYDTMGDSGNKAFSLRLENIGLKFLGIAKLPPGATINFFLFGDPSGSGALGWYAAYNQDNSTKLRRLAAESET